MTKSLRSFLKFRVVAIVHDYPLKLVQDMPGFFNKILHHVGGEQLTLDQIETDKLRKIYDDPRLHFALVCGPQSCPRLNRTAYEGTELFVQLPEIVKNLFELIFRA